jgi:hypothetical protein
MKAAPIRRRIEESGLRYANRRIGVSRDTKHSAAARSGQIHTFGLLILGGYADSDFHPQFGLPMWRGLSHCIHAARWAYENSAALPLWQRLSHRFTIRVQPRC